MHNPLGKCRYSNWFFVAISAILLSLSGLSACFDEEFLPGNITELEFSLDTLRFDTVFTSIGSATRLLKVYNRSDQNVEISSISLEKITGDMFRVNIDGYIADEVENVRVLANDSLYIFVEVTVDPDQPLSVSPFVIHDRISIRAGDAEKSVTLEAWGQNANYFPSRTSGGSIVGLSCNNNRLVWDDPKPYVVYGLLFIDSCILEIAQGTEIYFHGGLARIDELIFNDGGIFFLSGARMEALGLPEAPITFQGDRLEDRFDDVPGQWAGLRFLAGSQGNILQHVTIKNSIVGVRVDSSSTLDMTSCQIFNTANVGVIGIQASVTIDNSLVHSNGGQSCLFASGGVYSIRHSTLANYENQSPALYMDNFICLDANCEELLVNPLRARIVNSIIAGSNDDEITFIDATEGDIPEAFDISLNHVFLTIDQQREVFNYSESCDICIEDTGSPIFVDESEDNYQLDSLSLARDQGVFLTDLPVDLNNQVRDMMNPDLGCFEAQD